MAISIPQGLQISSKDPVDSKLILSFEQMRAPLTALREPDHYICLCSDDGKLYIYDASNTSDPITGKFRVYEEVIDIPAALKASFEKEPEATTEAVAQVLPPALKNVLENQSLGSGLKVDEEDNIMVNLDEDYFKLVDNKITIGFDIIESVE